MVKIIDFEQRQSDDGRKFNVLILQGGVEMVQSEKTGNFYATARKASIPSTFDAETAKNLVGQEMSGNIEKVNCEPYEVINQDTGQIITMEYRYEYVTEKPAPDLKGLLPEDISYSSNSVLDHA